MTLLLASVFAFLATTLAVLSLSATMSRRERIRGRFVGISSDTADVPSGTGPRLDAARLGLDAAAQRRLRPALQRAGFFGSDAVTIYAGARLALLAGLPLAGLVATIGAAPNVGIVERIAVAIVMLAIAFFLPKAFLSRRQRALEDAYRLSFPDFLDMLVVCINAGLSLEAALDRAGREIGRDTPAFAANLDLMAGEMRAGKSTGEALQSLADRLGLPEARSFAALLKQTIELGTDVARALTTFADEMRSRRLSRAEEKAAALPPKLTIPLGLFIFPVVLIAVLAPAVLRIMAVTAP